MKKVINILLNPMRNIENESFFFKIGLLKGILLLMCWMILSTIFSFIPSLIFNNNFLQNNFIIVGIFEFLSIPFLAFILSNGFGKITFRKNVSQKTNKRLLFLIFILVLCFRLLFDAYLYPLVNLLPDSDLLTNASKVYENNILYCLLTVCICAPIIEEIICRGILLAGLLNKYSSKIAIFISALLFALMHANLKQGINAFLLGLLLGYLYYKTKSVYITMFAHFSNNMLALILIIPTTINEIISIAILYTLISIPLIVYLKLHLHLKYKSNFIDIPK